MGKFTFEIKQEIGILSKAGKYSKELTIVSWNGGKPQIDLRTWKQQDGDKIPLKGISLTVDEAKVLRAVLERLEMLDNEVPQTKLHQ